MIKLQDMTPEIYYQQSRDFQFIGRLFDTVLNSVKTNADTIYNCPLSQNSSGQLLDLMTMTLGFKSRHNYNLKQLTALCSAFMEIIKNKGNRYALELAANTILNADGVVEQATVYIDENNYKVSISIPEAASDINLFKDLLTYILPAGMECEIIRESRISKPATTEFTNRDIIQWKWGSQQDTWFLNNDLSIIPQYSKQSSGNTQYAAAKLGNTAGVITNSLVWKPLQQDSQLSNISDTQDND